METKNKKTKVYTSKILEDFFTVKDTKEYKRTENNMFLALRIEKAMIAKGWNRVRFAKEMKVSPSVITKWLSGTHNFTSDTLFDIQDALCVCLINTSETQNVRTIMKYQIQVVTENQFRHPYSHFDGKSKSILNTPTYSYGKS
jgi:ribosome-binding protein aMBF1 (putative translation factor)